jgi:uncharacterized protein YidB (DUF937 family)
MGLLDGLLGQVLGGMAQGGGRGLPDLGDLGGRGGFGRTRGGVPGLGGNNVGGAALAAILAIGLQLLQRNGGIEGVLGKLQQKGYGREANSWVSTGDNEPIDADAISDVFGRDEVSQAAQQMGVDPQEALGGLAKVFPEIVNQITPTGRVESGSDDVVEQALAELKRRQQQAGRP